MRIEGHRRRRAAALAGAPAHAVDDLHVPAVQAVEVPERQHRVVPARRRIVGKVTICMKVRSQTYEVRSLPGHFY